LAQNRNAMQDDKTLFTEKVSAGKRTYFLDVKENHKGHQIFKLTESRKDNGEFIRHSVMIYQDDFDKIFEGIEKVKEFIRLNPSSQPNYTPPSEDLSF
jgi:hypothetical protein